MTLHIDLAPEDDVRLREQAAAAGKDVTTFAREALQESLRLEAESDECPRLSTEQRLAEFLAWAASARPLGYIVDDSRESIYEGRGE
ncbi:MAG: hypothetical protein AMXMBFR13_28790 [Phycisphaerae bacterium]